MGNLPRTAALLALAALGCSSTSTNEGSGGASGASSGGATSGAAPSGGAPGGGGAPSGGAAGGDAGAVEPVTCAQDADCLKLCGTLAPDCPAASGGSEFCVCHTAPGACPPGETAPCPAGMTCKLYAPASLCVQTIGTVSGGPCSLNIHCPPGETCKKTTTTAGVCAKPCSGSDAGCQCEPFPGSEPAGYCK